MVCKGIDGHVPSTIIINTLPIPLWAAAAVVEAWSPVNVRSVCITAGHSPGKVQATHYGLYSLGTSK